MPGTRLPVEKGYHGGRGRGKAYVLSVACSHSGLPDRRFFLHSLRKTGSGYHGSPTWFDQQVSFKGPEPEIL